MELGLPYLILAQGYTAHTGLRTMSRLTKKTVAPNWLPHNQ